MKRHIVLFLTLAFALLMTGLITSSVESSAPKVTGSAHWNLGGWLGKAETNIIYISPNEAKGNFNLIEKEADFYSKIRAHAVCIAFGEGYAGESASSLVLQIDYSEASIPGGGQVGQYIKLWLSDGGTPAKNGDFAGALVVPGSDVQPDCDYETPPIDFIWPLNDGGNISIHR
jgi:hypothetical protein